MRILLFVLLLCATGGKRLRGQIVNIEDLRIQTTNDSTRWYGTLRAAFNYTKVQQTVYQWQADSRIQYKRQRHIGLLLLNYNLLKAGNNDFLNSAFAHLRYNYNLTDSWVWEVYGQMQTNRLILIRNRNLVGTGLRKRLLLSADKRSRLYLGASWMWERNEFLEEPRQLSWNRLSTYISVSLRPPDSKIAFVATNYWQPVVGLIKNYRFLSDWALVMPIHRKLNFTLNFTFTREIGLPEGAPVETVNWRNGLLLTL